MFRNPYQMEYKGYIYLADTMDRDDGCDEHGCPIILTVNCHTVRCPDGKEIHMDWSQWRDVSREAFELWVDLGCPGRIGYHTLDMDDLRKLEISNQEASRENCI